VVPTRRSGATAASLEPSDGGVHVQPRATGLAGSVAPLVRAGRFFCSLELGSAAGTRPRFDPWWSGHTNKVGPTRDDIDLGRPRHHHPLAAIDPWMQ
jgi:hypothetical protein